MSDQNQPADNQPIVLRPDDRRRLLALLDGIVDGILEQPEAAAAFDAWAAAPPCSSEEVKARIRTLLVSFELRPLPPLGRDSWNYLADDLAESLYDYVTACKEWPPRRLVRKHDLSPQIGRWIHFGMSPWTSVVDARKRLQEFAASMEAEFRALEKAGKKAGRPASASLRSQCRDGRWLFLVEAGRAKIEELAADYHVNKGEKHEVESPSPCDSCIRLVYRQLATARNLLLADQIA